MKNDDVTEVKKAEKAEKKQAAREQLNEKLIGLLKEKQLSDEIIQAAEKHPKAKILSEALEEFFKNNLKAFKLNDLVLKIIKHSKPKEFVTALILLQDLQPFKIEKIDILIKHPIRCETVISLHKLKILTEANFDIMANPEFHTLERRGWPVKTSMRNILGGGLNKALVAYDQLQSFIQEGTGFKCSNLQKESDLCKEVQEKFTTDLAQTFFAGITQRHDPHFFAELLNVIRVTKSLDIFNQFVVKMNEILKLQAIDCIADALIELNKAELLTIESFNQVLEMQFPWHFTLLKNSIYLTKEKLEKLLKYDEPISSVSRLIEMIDRNEHEEILKDVRYAGGSLGQRARVRRDTLLNGENLNKLLQRDHSSLSNISDISEFLKTADLATEKNIKELINKDSKISKVLDFLKEHQLLTKENFSRLTGHSSRESASNFLEEHNLFSEENMNKLALESYPKVSFFQRTETELPESKSNPSCSFNLI